MKQVGKKKMRVLTAKPGLDGHDLGVKIVSRALRDAGMEVIYLGRHQTPAAIVSAAVEEDVDIIGLSILSGAHIALCSKVMKGLRERGASNIKVVVGGFVPEQDIPALKDLGIAEVFTQGALLDDIVSSLQHMV